MNGHVLRQDRENDCDIAMTWVPEGQRKRGRLKPTWKRTVEEERGEAGWSTWNEARQLIG